MPAPIFNKKPPINLSQAVELKEALEKMLPIPLGIEDVQAVKKYGRWQNAMELSKEALKITEQEDIKDAYYVLNDWQETLTEIPEYKEASRTLTPEEFAQLMKEEEIRSEKLKQTQVGQSEAVKAGIKKQQEIYAKVKADKAKLSSEEQKAAEEIVNQIKSASTEEEIKETIKTVEEVIKSRVPKEVSESDAELTAASIVFNVRTNIAPINQTAVVKSVTEEPKYKDLAVLLSDQGKTLKEQRDLISLTQNVTKLAFGEEFQKFVLPDVEVEEISPTPSAGFIPVRIPPAYKTTPQAEQTEVLTFGRTWVQEQLTQIGEGNIQGTNYNPNKLQSSFSAFKPLSGLARNAASKAVSKIEGSVAVKTGLKASITKATTAISTAIPIPGVNWLIGWVGGQVIGRAADWLSNHSKDIKKYALFIGSLPIIGAGLAFSIPALVIGGGVMGGIGLGMGAGMTLGSMGAGIGNFFSALGTAALGAIGVPILVTLLVFPVVVALILFIINSGAYIVPPSPLNLNLGGFSSPYVDVKKTASPAGPFSNSDFPKEVTYTINIKPKKGNLNNVQLSYDCQVISKANLSCPNIELDSKNSDVFTKPIETISASGISFTYKSTYSSQYKDSAIIDSIKLNGMSVDGNQVSTETSASVQFGTPPISCPLLGGHVATPSLNFSLNQSNNTGHGSQAYWKAMGQSPSAYSLPQQTGCHSVSECSYYGYAYDVFPTGSKDVYAPTVLGKDVTWNCSYGFVNKNAGNTYICTGDNETLVLTHMNKGAKTGPIKSGEKIGTLYNQIGNTHLHIEFQINGRYVKPENYFCGGK